MPPASTSPSSPAPFDWQDYFSLAEGLRDMTAPSAHRSAISRAYYAVFHKAERIYARSHTVSVPGLGGQSHTDVWKWFERGNTSYKKVAQAGWRLKRYRERADYEDVFAGLTEQAALQVASAKDLLERLDRILSSTST